MECACFLRKKEILEKKSWQNFTKQFFERYKEDILAYYGYPPQAAGHRLVCVNDKQLFLAVMAALCKTGKIGDSQKAVSEAIYSGFDLEMAVSTLQKQLSDILFEYETVFGFFAKFKKNDF